MPEFIFYTFEGYTVSPNNNDLDSMQVLGFEEEDTVEIALKNLIDNNAWIEESGFDVGKIQSKQTLTKTEMEDLSAIIEYLWEDEERHFEELNEPENHIFSILKRLKYHVYKHFNNN